MYGCLYLSSTTKQDQTDVMSLNGQLAPHAREPDWIAK